ncbi:hypothetical protein ACF0H5_022389 [Mactra antiquata]
MSTPTNIEGFAMYPHRPSPTRVKVMSAKRNILRKAQNNFGRACDQIVILNRRMEGVLYRYNKARIHTNRSFRYKLRLRLAIVEGVRNMFYEYANRKAHEIVKLRRDLFGEIVEVISDEAVSDNFYAADSQVLDYDEEYDVTSDDSEIEENEDEPVDLDADWSP